MQSNMNEVRRLTLHVGLPKTATTTLQTHVFPQVPGFIGRSKANLSPATEAPYRKFRAVADQWARGRSAPSADLVSFIATLCKFSSDEVLVSEEALSRWVIDDESTVAWPFHDGCWSLPRVRPHPLSRRLAELRVATDDHFNVRIILTLRNQAHFMASLYAQQQREMFHPSQTDFEAKIARALDIDEPAFDWASLVEELRRSVGDDDVLILLHEDGIERNASRIAKFLKTPLSTTTNVRENVKREGPQAWRGTWVEPVTDRGALHRVRRTTNRLWPEVLRPLAPPLKRMLVGLDAAVACVIEPKHRVGVRVELTHELTEKIRHHYRPSNDRLGQMIGRNLQSLGY